MQTKPSDAQEISKILLWEEFRAERVIGLMRAILYGCAWVEMLFLSNTSMGDAYRPLVTPFLIMFLITIGMLLDILLYGAKRMYKYFNRFTKFGIITADTALASYLVHQTYTAEGLQISGQWSPPLFCLAVGAILVSSSIFRYSPGAVLPGT